MNHLTSDDLQALERLTPATLATRLSGGSWQPARHLLLIALEIAVAIRQGCRNLIVCAPPRHGKTELISCWTPIWALDRNPDHHIILTGYGAELVRGFSRRVRDTIIYWTQEGDTRNYLRCPLKQDSKNVDAWETQAGGGMYAMGVGGTILGRGGNVLIIDDYIKNVKEAESATMLQDLWDWFRGVSLSRLEPGAVQIIVASRWNKKDLVGRILEEEPGLWKIINFPALALDPEKFGPDLLGRAKDIALWPERYSTEHIKMLRKRMGSYLFDAQYQQAPHARAADSERTSSIVISDIVPENPMFRRCRSWDLAASGKKGDLMIGSLIMRDDVRKKTIFLDVFETAPRAGIVERHIIEHAKVDGIAIPIIIEQEPGSAGKIWAESLKEKLPGYMVKFRASTGSKWIRAQPLITAAENNKIELKRGAWNDRWLDEFCSFDGASGGEDNRVDSASLGFNYLNGKIQHAGTWGRVARPSDIVSKPRGALIVGPTFGRG